MRSKFKTQIAVALLIILMISVPFCIKFNKPDIHTAKHYELIEIQSIGDELATDIIEYLGNNKNAVIDDLIAIDGIGEKRIEYLKGVYDD